MPGLKNQIYTLVVLNKHLGLNSNNLLIKEFYNGKSVAYVSL